VEVCASAEALFRNVKKLLKDVAKDHSPKELPHLISVLSRITERYPSFLDAQLVTRIFRIFARASNDLFYFIFKPPPPPPPPRSTRARTDF
jgi:hypothetical protein